jgi:DNA-binding GntR family transcriptional regulator
MGLTFHPAASVDDRDDRWDRLQDLLIQLKPGQRVTISGLAARTGVDVESVDTVLQALTRAELFVKVDETTFIRERLRSQVSNVETPRLRSA